MAQQIDYEGARAVLEADCEARYTYVDADGATCAIGALALAAGVSALELRALGTIAIYGKTLAAADVEKIRSKTVAAIRGRFGLSSAALGKLQRVNDLHQSADTRRQAVLAELERLAVRATGGAS